MKKIQVFSFSILLTLIIACGSTSKKSGFTLRGTIEGAENLTAKLLQVSPSSKNVIGETTLDANGAFSIHVEKKLEAGLYNFEIGKQSAPLIFNGKENEVKINGALSGLPSYDFTLEGSEASDELLNTISKLKNQEMKIEDIKEFAKNSNDPMVGFYTAIMGTRGSDQYLDVFENALNRIKQEYGEDNNVYKMYQPQIRKMKSRKANQLSVGDQAPDIVMPDPNGKTYKLSDLKGKIVLLDFWASWCRPCRMANPHVVEMYDKYNDKGFTVFSVSLDGLDSRTKKRLGGDESRIDNYIEQQKQRWVNAIEKDNLKWEYHVSDLKKWDSEASALYGVRSIPRTFLLDRDGKIAAVNPRNNLEEEIKKLLK